MITHVIITNMLYYVVITNIVIISYLAVVVFGTLGHLVSYRHRWRVVARLKLQT